MPSCCRLRKPNRALAGAAPLSLLDVDIGAQAVEHVLGRVDAAGRRARHAAILGLDTGHLSLGSNADLCIFDPEHYWKIEAGSLISQGKNTPFLGMELAGKVRYTLLHGQTVHQAS